MDGKILLSYDVHCALGKRQKKLSPESITIPVPNAHHNHSYYNNPSVVYSYAVAPEQHTPHWIMVERMKLQSAYFTSPRRQFNIIRVHAVQFMVTEIIAGVRREIHFSFEIIMLFLFACITLAKKCN